MANQYQDSPFGVGKYLHVNKADRGVPGKFESAPTFKVDLSLFGEEALELKGLVDERAEAAHEAFKETDQFAKMKPKDQRELGVYYPYEEVEDDNGDKTGEIIFHFRQNEKIKLKDGTFKTIKMGIYDAAGKEFNKLVTSGSELRVRFSTRPIMAPSTPKKYGVRLDFMGIQVRKLRERGGSGGGFGAVDGYVDDGVAGYEDNSEARDNTPSSDDADY
nr:hypothetical protein [uncultured Gellertiella sp.]